MTGASQTGPQQGDHGDNAALRRAARGDAALCTITAIEGSFSRRLGAQLAIGRDAAVTGSMADGCLEGALIRHAAEALEEGAPRFVHFGGVDDPMDMQLPCGSRLAITVDPLPDPDALRRAVGELDAREEAVMHVPLADGGEMLRPYRPELRIVAAGTGPELEAFVALSRVQGAKVETLRPFGADMAGAHPLSLGQPPEVPLDRWSAVVVLFHDHEWERTILPWAVLGDAFYIGAQGGAATRDARAHMLAGMGLAARAQGRLHGPVGLIGRARDPAVLALSVLAEVVQAYEAGA